MEPNTSKARCVVRANRLGEMLNVALVCDLTEVSGVYTASISANVVNHKAINQWPDILFVHPPMNTYVMSVFLAQ